MGPQHGKNNQNNFRGGGRGGGFGGGRGGGFHQPEPGCKLYVGNLNYDVREHDLEAMFGVYGQLTNVKVVMDREDPTRSRGFAFISFATKLSSRLLASLLTAPRLLPLQTPTPQCSLHSSP